MNPTSRMTRVVALVATGLAALLVAGCATGHIDPHPGMTVVPAAIETVQTILHVGGLDRAVTIRDLHTTSTALVPALILLHSAGGSSALMERETGMTAVAQKDGFVVAFGNGTPTHKPLGGLSWNAGKCCAVAVTKNIDDVAYVSAVIANLVADHHVDPSRIYLGGLSNGGMLSYRFACELGDRLAGIVVVAGALNVASPCAASKALPVLIVHGTADTVVPYAGGPDNATIQKRLGYWVNASVADASTYWSTRDGCGTHSVISETKVRTEDRYDGCADGSSLEVVTITGGGHVWPTSAKEGFDTSDFIAHYFGLAA